MRIDLTVVDDTELARDIAIECAPGTSWRDVAPQVHRLTGVDVCRRLWTRGRAVEPCDELGVPPLRSGAALRTSIAAPPDAGLWRLEHICGPAAGTVTGLAARPTVVIGRDPACDVVVDDPGVSRRHASIMRTGADLMIVDHNSANGTLVHGRRVGRHRLAPGDVVRLGDSVVRLSALGTVLGRGDRSPLPAVINVPDLPARRGVGMLRWIGVIAPVALGVCLALVTGDVRLMAFAAMTPLTLAASFALHPTRGPGQRRGLARRRRHVAERELALARAAEARHRHTELPDPVVLRTGDSETAKQTAIEPLVRLGLADLPSRVHTKDGDTESTDLLPLVPLGVDLAGSIVDLLLPVATARGLARWMVMQIVVAHRQLRGAEVLLLLDEQSAPHWLWARWLPGCVAAVSEPAMLRALEEGSHRDLIASARDPARARRLVIVDMAEYSCAALSSDAATTIVIVSAEQRPANALRISPGRSPHQIVVPGPPHSDGATHAIADQVSVAWADSFARELAGAGEVPSSGQALPASCRLIELIDAEGELSGALQRGWASASARRQVPVGRSADGEFAIDLVRDGPHALVAGTTGSGKSEFLQSWLISLALASAPDRLAFVLLDFKGGAAFGPLQRLPHVCGMLTDLHAGAAERALDSLRAEMRRRERLFAQSGAPDLEAYRRTPSHEPVPRLVIVVDEFAALSDQLPDVLQALVAIAQRGRSLGMHLVLATQRPSGVVSSDIRANVTLRVALRTSDQSDSHEVIGTDAAHHISAHTPGRAFVLIDGVRTEIQVASVSGRNVRVGEPTVRPLGPWREPTDAEPDGDRHDIDVLVDTIADAAIEAGYRRATAPWRPPLPSELVLDDLPDESGVAAFGLIDRPHRQDQVPLTVHVPTGGGLLITGSPGSGRTTALLALAAASRRSHCGDELAVVAIDCAGGRLAGRVNGPATVLCDGDAKAITTAVERLGDELRMRRRADPRHRAASVERDAGPHILCVVDGWEQLLEMSHRHDRGLAADGVLALLRNCTGTGVIVAVAGDRGTLLPTVAGCAATHLLLRTAEPSDLTAIGVPRRRRPAPWPPGRGFRVADGYEIQIVNADRQPMCGYR